MLRSLPLLHRVQLIAGRVKFNKENYAMSCKKHSNHEHHLKQRYKGGTDEESNKVTIADTCHTMWHWCEWKRTGNNEDRGAYLLLRGQLENENHSRKLVRLWADPVYHSWMLECSKDRVEKQKETGFFSDMGKKGGQKTSSSPKGKMMRLQPSYQRQVCTQNSPELKPLLNRWLTFENKNGSKFTVKFDYSTRVITQKLSLLSGKVCSAKRWTSLFTEGKVVAGWKLISVSI
jgi:hypothetical protein